MPHMGSVSRNNNRDKTKDNSLFVCRPRCWVWTDKPENEFSFISSESADLITRRRWWLGHSFPIPRRSSWTASLLHVPSILARFYTTHVRSHRFHSRSRQCAGGFACRPHCFVSHPNRGSRSHWTLSLRRIGQPSDIKNHIRSIAFTVFPYWLTFGTLSYRLKSE